MDQRTVLLMTLELAVPMHIAELRGLPPEQLGAMASHAATEVGTHGDDLMFGGKHCADTFNALARGLAVLALLADGGVLWLGAHWCVTPGCRSQDAHLDDDPERALEPTSRRRPIETVPTHGRT